ncbi:MAG: sulfatase-like hydrolase/transferase [Planctomycetota bacterium]
MIRLILALLVSSSTLVAADRPNILVLYSDDNGYGDFGFQPDCVPEMKKLTPNIDSIARDGVRFTNAYMSGCVCSPSRAGLMTGRYQGRFGFDNNLPPGTPSGLPLTETFFAKRLQKAGYRTGLVGKWHLGYPQEYHPNRRGFEWFYGLLQGSRSYLPYVKPTAHRVIQEATGVAVKRTAESGYVTDRFGSAACRFIKSNSKRPFFLFVSFTASHGPNQPRSSDADRISHISPKKRRDHCGLTVALDDNVGRILRCLEEQGYDKNTLVVYTNDNGGATHTGARNNPLSGRKGELREGGVRVPMAMRWPGKIQAGSVIGDPVIALDFAPTFLTLGGVELRDDMKLDGVNLVDRVRGKTPSLPKRTFYWRKAGSKGHRALRDGNWKLVHRRKIGAAPQLFDLSKDISESNDLAASKKDVVDALMKKLDVWETQLVEPLWGAGAPKSAPQGKANRKKKKRGQRKPKSS